MPRTRSRANKLAELQTNSIFSKVLDDNVTDKENTNKLSPTNKRKSTGSDGKQSKRKSLGRRVSFSNTVDVRMFDKDKQQWQSSPQAIDKELESGMDDNTIEVAKRFGLNQKQTTTTTTATSQNVKVPKELKRNKKYQDVSIPETELPTFLEDTTEFGVDIDGGSSNDDEGSLDELDALMAQADAAVAAHDTAELAQHTDQLSSPLGTSPLAGDEPQTEADAIDADAAVMQAAANDGNRDTDDNDDVDNDDDDDDAAGGGDMTMDLTAPLADLQRFTSTANNDDADDDQSGELANGTMDLTATLGHGIVNATMADDDDDDENSDDDDETPNDGETMQLTGVINQSTIPSQSLLKLVDDLREENGIDANDTVDFTQTAEVDDDERDDDIDDDGETKILVALRRQLDDVDETKIVVCMQNEGGNNTDDTVDVVHDGEQIRETGDDSDVDDDIGAVASRVLSSPSAANTGKDTEQQDAPFGDVSMDMTAMVGTDAAAKQHQRAMMMTRFGTIDDDGVTSELMGVDSNGVGIGALARLLNDNDNDSTNDDDNTNNQTNNDNNDNNASSNNHSATNVDDESDAMTMTMDVTGVAATLGAPPTPSLADVVARYAKVQSAGVDMTLDGGTAQLTEMLGLDAAVATGRIDAFLAALGDDNATSDRLNELRSDVDALVNTNNNSGGDGETAALATSGYTQLMAKLDAMDADRVNNVNQVAGDETAALLAGGDATAALLDGVSDDTRALMGGGEATVALLKNTNNNDNNDNNNNDNNINNNDDNDDDNDDTNRFNTTSNSVFNMTGNSLFDLTSNSAFNLTSQSGLFSSNTTAAVTLTLQSPLKRVAPSDELTGAQGAFVDAMQRQSTQSTSQTTQTTSATNATTTAATVAASSLSSSLSSSSSNDNSIEEFYRDASLEWQDTQLDTTARPVAPAQRPRVLCEADGDVTPAAIVNGSSVAVQSELAAYACSEFARTAVATRDVTKAMESNAVHCGQLRRWRATFEREPAGTARGLARAQRQASAAAEAACVAGIAKVDETVLDGLRQHSQLLQRDAALIDARTNAANELAARLDDEAANLETRAQAARARDITRGLQGDALNAVQMLDMCSTLVGWHATLHSNQLIISRDGDCGGVVRVDVDAEQGSLSAQFHASGKGAALLADAAGELEGVRCGAALKGALALLGGRLTRAQCLLRELRLVAHRFNLTWRVAGGALHAHVSVSHVDTRRQCNMHLTIRHVAKYPGGKLDVQLQPSIGTFDCAALEASLRTSASAAQCCGEAQRILSLCSQLADKLGSSE